MRESDQLISASPNVSDSPLDIQASYIPERPPWYWRMIGREYWSGWYIEATACRLGERSRYAASRRATAPPTPQEVVAVTRETIQRVVNDRVD